VNAKRKAIGYWFFSMVALLKQSNIRGYCSTTDITWNHTHFIVPTLLRGNAVFCKSAVCGGSQERPSLRSRAQSVGTIKMETFASFLIVAYADWISQIDGIR